MIFYHNIRTFLSQERQLIKVDRAFQRKSCWTLAQKRRYIISFLKNRTPYPVVLADIRTGLMRSKDIQSSEDIRKYEELTNEGKSRVSLDGQNRIKTLEEFYNNAWGITGDLMGADGVVYPVKDVLYKDLPTRLKDAFDMLQVSVYVQQNCLYSELHTIFVDINDGEGLNPQEKRNAIMTWFSGHIRNFAETQNHEKLLLRISGMKEQDIKRSTDAEWYTKAYVSLVQPDKHYLNRSGLDAFYKQGEGRQQASISDYSRDKVDRFEKVVEMVYRAVFSKTVIGTPISQKLFWALLIASADVYDTGQRITDYSILFDAVKQADCSLCIDSNDDFVKDFKTWQGLPNPCPKQEPKKSQYYFHWASDVNKPTVRQKRKSELLRELKNMNLYHDSFKVQSQAAK
tara:strand:+ start:3672 stop:4871 length:1200 start_codon:yes stop_codon:yes gene_type:complete